MLAELHEAEARLARGDRRAAPPPAAPRSAPAARTDAARAVAPRPKPVPPPELKKLFRDAAKRMHPDVAAGPDARLHAEAFMKRLTTAYRDGDGERILDLMRQWDASPFAAEQDDPVVLDDAVAQAQRRLEAVRASEMAELMERHMAAAVEGRDYLAELRAGIEANLAAARARLTGLGT